ncbi:MAG: PAS domain S-box protein [Vicinamibacteria bacterium]|nr:PAS domain S-box protein [Vicinamibacteria bacterium]
MRRPFGADTGQILVPRLPGILLVEDDEPHSELIRRAFERSSTEVRLTWVTTILEAQRHLEETILPDLVITDLRLPDGDGLVLLPESRERAAYAVVVMTSHGDEKVAVDAMKTGALDYVVKSEESFARMPEIADRALRTWTYIVERRRAEETLRAREEHFRSLIENAHDIIWILSSAGRIKYASPACARVLGYAAEGLVGQSVLDLSDGDNREGVRAAIDAVFAQPDIPVASLLVLRARDGSERILESIGSTRGSDSRPTAIVNSRDVTERARAEEAAALLEAQLQQARRLETLGTLAGGIAHDFNNIVQAILGCAELAQMSLPEESPATPYLSRVSEAAHRARELVQQILSFSRQDESRRSEVEPFRLVDETLALFRSTLPAHIQITETRKPTGAVLADPTQLHQVLLNLLTNARHALEPRGGMIEIGIESRLVQKTDLVHPSLRPGPHVRLWIKDNGEGMSQTVADRVFEPFFTTKPVGQGTGLGLSVVHGIVTRMGGAILVETEPGVGTRFEVYIPESPAQQGGGGPQIL